MVYDTGLFISEEYWVEIKLNEHERCSLGRTLGKVVGKACRATGVIW